ncbi:hypothetical protein QFZ87_003052 [Bacillus sp. SLBN-46]|uniref:hypothetical protein n=1 Tax=Bacillus sp. SLBN-46 TaxID=3042283 RepID=UPI00285C6653|nr:hypothetical protein [Bacillus sp. SLBN-46]MDR6123455.1 hypothetical protein [Bacillus sp. SLBN-46]
MLVEKAEILSKGKATSDRVEGKSRKIVQRLVKFGQSWWKKQKHCPKEMQLRTELGEKGETLSKVKATSDRVGRKGVTLSKVKGTSDRVGRKGETLSKVKATLDSVEGKTRKIVKRQRNFGQSWWEKQKHCQKAGQLQPVLAEKAETLSKGCENSKEKRR